MKTYLRLLWLALLVPLSVPYVLSQQADIIRWTPTELANGSPCLFIVQAPKATVVSGQWQSHKLTFFRSQNSNSWYALAGIDVEAAPGSYPLTVELINTDGSPQTLH